MIQAEIIILIENKKLIMQKKVETVYHKWNSGQYEVMWSSQYNTINVQRNFII